jgi:Uma2 family endonuclease
MMEVKLGIKMVEVPYTLRMYDVTEEMFDELVDEDTRAEHIDGVMIVYSPVSLRHSSITGFLRMLLRGYSAENHLGLVLGPNSLIHLAEGRRFAPDAFFIRQKRVPEPLPSQFEGAPDLVVEVLSPSNRLEDLHGKRPTYREARVPEIWYVDPQHQQVIVDRLSGQQYVEQVIESGRLSAHALPGFWIETDWLWTEPLPNEMACLRKILARK